MRPACVASPCQAWPRPRTRTTKTRFVQRGQALVDRGQYQEAVKVCRLGLLASPTEVAGRLVLATALAELERYDEVLAEMRVALELEPSNARGHVLKARALLRKGDALQAREILDRANQLDPSDGEMHDLMRQASEALGASGKPRLASAGLTRDSFDSPTKHYPAHHGVEGQAPDAFMGPPPGFEVDAERSGTIELDPELEGVEIGSSHYDGDPVAEPPLPAVREESVVELSTGDVELVTGSDVAALPDPSPSLGFHEPAAPEEPTGHYRHPALSPRPGPGPAMDSAPPLEELFPEQESGVSGAEVTQAPVSGSIETPPRHNVPGQPGFDGGPSIPSLAHSADPRVGPELADQVPRARTGDMQVIKHGLGMADATESRWRRRRRPRGDRTSAVAAPRRARDRRGRAHLWLYAVVAVVVIAGAVFAGLAVRNARLDRQIKRAMRDADRLAASDTYRGYLRASEAHARIVQARDSATTRAAAARVEAAIAAEFGERIDGAREAVGRLGRSSGEDALVARAYLAIADGDVAAARTAADRLVKAYPKAHVGHYLLGRAALLADNPEAAVTALRASLAIQVSPAAYVGLCVAEATVGRFPEALASCDAALSLSQAHSAAVIERTRVLVWMNQLTAPGELEAGLDAVIADGGRPLSGQRIGVARQQVGWAALARGELALARGDRAAAKKFIELGAQSRPLADGRFSDALCTSYLATGNLEKARAEAEGAVARWPQRAGSQVRVAEIALVAGDPEAGLAAVATLVDIDKHPEALAVRGRARLALHKLDEASNDLDAALAARPQLREAQIARAEVELHRGDARGAVKRLQPIYEASSSPEIGVVYAAALRRSGERERARTVLERALESPRAGAGAHLELARLNRDEGRFKAARQSYARAIEADPAGIDARLEAAQLAHELGDFGGAREALDLLSTDAPAAGRVLLAAARLHIMTGDMAGGAALIDQAAKLATTPTWLVERERGRLALRTRQATLAATHLTAARRQRPDDGEARLLLIDSYLMAEDGKGANDALGDVLKQFAKRPEADLALGRVHLFNDRLGEAMVALKNARRSLSRAKAPPRRIAAAHYWIGRVHYFDGSLRSARKSLRRAVKLDPGNADAYFVLGQVELDANHAKAAAAAWKLAVAVDPRGIPDAWFLLGESHATGGRNDEAREALQRFIELVPTGELTAEAKQLLSTL